MTDVVPPERLVQAGRQGAGPHSRWTGAATAVMQALLIVSCLFLYLRGWDRDFTVPLRFADDSLVALLQSKGTVEHGWWWFNPQFGAPFGLDLLQFPANSNVDQLVIWIVSRVVGDAMTAVNVAWVAMVVLSGLTATWCMRQLGVSAASAVAAGTLFALMPYALYRNINHLWMVIYLVPFVCTAALLLATGRPDRWYWGRPFVVLVAGCALIGFNYVYYAFFGCFILLVGVGIGTLQHRAVHVAGAGMICLALIGGGTLLNLTPSLHSWREQGRPLILHEKTPAESEVYGLKIRQLISPLLWHRFPPFQAWLEREQRAAFPLETENANSRLGLVASAGFLVLLGLLFVPRAVESLSHAKGLLAAARLTLAAVLLATIGGFGSLVSLLVTSEIRAYNRISPFIMFFSLTAVAFLIDALFKSRNRRLAAALVIVVLGLADQRAGAVHMNAIHRDVALEVTGLRTFMGELESRLPAGSMVFQLPLRTYLNDPGTERMRPYDHLKVALASRTLIWSYPALANRQVRWHQAAALLEPRQLARELAAQDFAAVLVDRYGYPDNGAAIAAALLDQPEPLPIIGATSRYLVVDIRPLADAPSVNAILARAAATSPATAGMEPCEGQTVSFVDQLGTATVSSTGEYRVRRRGTLKVAGWAVDEAAGTAAGGVDVLVDETPFQTIYGMDRPDVADHFDRPAYRQSGFLAGVPTTRLDEGAHTLALRIAAADGGCYYQTSPLIVVID